MKRRGVIAALLSFVAAKAQEGNWYGRRIIDLSPISQGSGEIDWPATERLRKSARCCADNLVVLVPSSKIPQSLEVRLGSRSVLLTAEQIMDALEGKQ